MIKVGVTGGIGSGKSLVCEIFRKLGVNVYVADDRAKILINTDLQIKEKFTSRFGSSIYKNDQLDRGMLAGIIFDDRTALEFVNSLVHPAVTNDFYLWSARYEAEPYIVEEAALLYESGSYKGMDQMVTVYAPLDLRVTRAMMRDKSSADLVKQRMNNQLSDEEKLKLSDFVIYNDEKHSVLEQVLNLHNLFLSSTK